MSTAAHRAYVAPRGDLGARLAGLGWLACSVAYLVLAVVR
jgi:hypothetical protein